jgi:O-methyltransferase
MPPEKRYLDLLRKSLLNEPYLENEARLFYLFACLHARRPIDEGVLRDIRTRFPQLFEQLREGRASGKPWYELTFRDADNREKTLNLRNVCEFSHTMMGAARMAHLEGCLDAIRAEDVPGDFLEAGVWRGGAVVFMRGYLEAWGMPGRRVFAADSFQGLPEPTLPEDAGRDFSRGKAPILAITQDEVRETFRRYGLLDERVVFLEGWFKDTLPVAPVERLALLRLDGDLYESTRDAIEPLYDKVAPGGFVIVDDYGDFEACRKAIDEFRARRGITEPLEMIDWSGAFWRKAS